MKSTSTLYKSLRQQEDSFYDVQVVLDGGTSYGNDTLRDVKIHVGLFDGSGPQVGQTCAAQCEITVRESSANWPRMAHFTVQVRLNSGDGQSQTEWVTLGSYYTDERSEDEFGNLSIVAYDEMLLTEQYWTDKITPPANWPITAKAWADLIEAAGLAQFDSRTVLDNTVAFVGLNTASTVRDVLKDIAAAHGGNWQMTEQGKLRLIPFVNMVDGQAAIAGIAIAGVAVVGSGETGIPGGTDYVYLGMAVQTFRKSPELQAVTGVHLETEAGDIAEAGTDLGYRINGACEFSNSAVGTMCLSKVTGYVYRPFEAGSAILDPAAEVGDIVVINGKSYQMATADWNINSWPTASISAPYDEEVDHEYTILSPEAKSYRKSVAETEKKLTNYPTIYEVNSAIQQSANSITQSVSLTYVQITDYDAAISDLQSQIDGAVSTFSGPVVPTMSNYPADEWITDAQKQQHVGSLYLVTSDEGSPQAGQYYRFEQNGSDFNWVIVEDSALAAALAEAAAASQAAAQAIADAEAARAAADAAQGTADQARLEAVAEAAEAKAIAIAQAAVDATNKANAALEEAKAYADSQFASFINGEYAETIAALQNQLDEKAETFYQATDPSIEWSNTIAGIAVAGVSIVGSSWSGHEGDLWYKTTDGTTWYWNGTQWVQQNIPDAVFDKIDGKAQIFVTQPTPPYAVGDLWFNSANSDIMTCINARATGSFTASDWEKRNKYTDDSALATFIAGTYATDKANIQTQLDGKAETWYQSTDPAASWTTPELRAEHEGDLWYNTSTGTTWYFNGSTWDQQNIPDSVFDTIDGKSSIYISQPTPPYNVGDLWFDSATSDIMTCVTARINGNFSASDWQKRNKYTDDTKAEEVEADLAENYSTTVQMRSAIEETAESITALVEQETQRATGEEETLSSRITQNATEIAAKVSSTGGTSQSFGWTLTDSSWSIVANSTTVLSVTSAGLVLNGTGTFTNVTIAGNLTVGGSPITAQSLYTGASQAASSYGSWNTAATQAAYSDAVFNNTQTANYCKANWLEGASVYGTNYYVNFGDSYGSINGHTHQISESGGVVTIGEPDFSGRSHSFNIADTEFYKDAVSAITTTSITAQRTTSDSNVVWNPTTKELSADFTLSAKNANGSVVYREVEYPIILPAIKAYNAGVDAGAESVYVIGLNSAITNTHLEQDGHHFVVADVTASARGYKSDGTYAEDEKTFENRRFTADAVYNDGVDAGAGTVDVRSVTASVTNTHLEENGHHYVVTSITATARATKSDGIYATDSETFTERKITADAVYSDGYDTGYGEAYPNTLTITPTYNSSTHTYSIQVTATNSAGTTLKTRSTATGTEAYDAGVIAGSGTASIRALSERSYDSSDNIVSGTITASGNTLYSGGYLFGCFTATLGSGATQTIRVGLNATNAYNAGATAEAAKYTPVEVNLRGARVTRYTAGNSIPAHTAVGMGTNNVYYYEDGRYYRYTSTLYYPGTYYAAHFSVGTADYYYKDGGTATYYQKTS